MQGLDKKLGAKKKKKEKQSKRQTNKIKIEQNKQAKTNTLKQKQTNTQTNKQKLLKKNIKKNKTKTSKNKTKQKTCKQTIIINFKLICECIFNVSPYSTAMPLVVTPRTLFQIIGPIRGNTVYTYRISLPSTVIGTHVQILTKSL